MHSHLRACLRSACSKAGWRRRRSWSWATPRPAREASAQEPYRWNASESQAGAINSAEVIGKQLVGKKAQYGGDDVKSQTRKFGVVYDPDATDYAGFTSVLAKYKGKVTTPIEISSATDPTQVATVASTAVTKMKAAGVTTVAIFSGYVKDLMNAADKQEWTPEWFYTGTGFADLAVLALGYPVTQSKHGFGISAIPAWAETEQVTPPEVPYRTKVDPLNWYWGIDAGTEASRIAAPLYTWLLPGIQAAGPKLTPQTFQQGLFALPPRGGAVDDQTYGTLSRGVRARSCPTTCTHTAASTSRRCGSTRTPPVRPTAWSSSARVSTGSPTAASATSPPRGPRSRSSGSTRTGAIYHFTSVPQIGYVGDCTNCPSTGAAGSTEAPSDTAIVFKAGGSSASAA